jgi:outer membrane usher protein FimD/PapC
MVKLMKLSGQLRLNMNKTITFMSTIYDGTPFECNVDIHDYEQNEEFQPGKYTVDGWLFVVQEAKQDDKCYLTLPKPSIVFGRQILVKELQLMPRAASIADFKPQKQGGKPSTPVGEVVDRTVADATLSQLIAEEVAKKGSKS